MERFKEKYTADKTKLGEAEKTEITKEAFAVGEMIELLIDKIEQVRQTWR